MNIHSYTIIRPEESMKDNYVVVRTTLLEVSTTTTDWFRNIILSLIDFYQSIGLYGDSPQVFIVMNSVTINTVLSEYNLIDTEELLSRMALPIHGKWYSIMLDEQVSDNDVYFIVAMVKS